MMKYKKFLCLVCAAVLTAALLCACSSETKEKYPTPTERFFINDYANVIDDTAEQEIYARGADLDQKTTAQVVAVTVKTTDGEDISDYALQLGREWGIGAKEQDNGILILLAVEDRQVYIAVGYGLEGALPDSKTGRILDTYGTSYLSEDHFSEGMLSVYKAVVNEVSLEYGIETEEGYIPIDQISQNTQDGYGTKVGFSWLIMIGVIFLYLSIFGRRRRGFIWFGGGPFGGGGFRGGGFGGGGFGGGGFGGGSGGFSGGGGSFGGGGAGRGF